MLKILIVKQVVAGVRFGGVLGCVVSCFLLVRLAAALCLLVLVLFRLVIEGKRLC